MTPTSCLVNIDTTRTLVQDNKTSVSLLSNQEITSSQGTEKSKSPAEKSTKKSTITESITNSIKSLVINDTSLAQYKEGYNTDDAI